MGAPLVALAMRLTRTAAVHASRKKNAERQAVRDANRLHLHHHHHHHHHPHASWSGGTHPYSVNFHGKDIGLVLLLPLPSTSPERSSNVIVHEAYGPADAKHVLPCWVVGLPPT